MKSCNLNCIKKISLFQSDSNEFQSYISDLNCNFTETDGEILIELKSVDDITIDKFIQKFKDDIFSLDGENLQSLFVKLVKSNGIVMSVAESFTGGALSHAITSVSGASAYFYEGQITYDSRAKNRRLGVSNEILEKYKPVSSQVAEEMCKGLLSSEDINFAISTTGIAGPNSDDSDFPVGLCYIGVGDRNSIQVYKYNFSGSRNEIMHKGVNAALFQAVKRLKTYEVK